MYKIGFAVTGSFCSMNDMLEVLKQVCQHYDVEVFITPHVHQLDTRFYTHNTRSSEKRLKKSLIRYSYNDSRGLKSMDQNHNWMLYLSILVMLRR